MDGASGLDETAGDGSGGNVACDQDTDCVADCAAGTCEGNVCAYEPTLVGECRPLIEVEYPLRGATIAGELDETVEVVGRVTTGIGSIDSLTLGGEALVVDSDGNFTAEVDPEVGGNTLVFEAVDSNGWTRRRVQSFLWSTEFMLPTEPMEGTAPQGLLMYLDQVSLDDGDRSPPINDLASVFHLTLESLDLGAFVDPATPMVQQAGYDIFLTTLTNDSVTVVLDGIDGGMHIDAGLNDIYGDLIFDCTNLLCLAAGGDGTGYVEMDSIDISGDILISASRRHEMDVQLVNVSTQVNGLNLHSNNLWTNFLLTIIEPLVLGGVATDVENLLNDEVVNTLGPLLADGLGGFSISAPIAFPSLADPKGEITVQLETDVGATDFHDGSAPPEPSPPQGGLLDFRGAGYVADRMTPYENLGIPYRAGCESGESTLAVPREAALEIGLSDDLLNQLLYGAWAGGLLEFELASDDGGGGEGGIGVMSVELSGMLAPTATDCGPDGELLAHIGDLEITASLELGGVVTDFVAYSSMALLVEISGSDEGISIAIPSIEWMETELVVVQDGSIPQEDSFREIVEAMIEQQLLSGLSEGFGGISLPEIDLSEVAGLPPGSALLEIHVESAVRRDGVSVLNAHF